MRTSRASSSDAEDLCRFFAACGSACCCRYWHFEGDKNDWLDRCANRAEENRGELVRELGISDPSAYGVVAREADGEEIVGWLKLVRPGKAPKIVEQRYYRGLPCLREGLDAMLIVGCILVRPTHRHRGVARSLVLGGIDVAREVGAKAVVALPRASTERVSDEELWLGPLSVFAGLGFREVHDERPYPVLRLDLAEGPMTTEAR